MTRNRGKGPQQKPLGRPLQGGFTLIELLVVVLIIGILVAVALPQYQRAVLRARAAELLLVGNTVRRAQQAYFLANGQYTASLEGLGIEIPCEQSRYTEDENIGLAECKNSYHYLYSNMVSSHLTHERSFWINMYYDRRSAPYGGVMSLCSATSETAASLCGGMGGVYLLTDGEGVKRYAL